MTRQRTSTQKRLKKTWIPIALGLSSDGRDRDEDLATGQDDKSFRKRARAADIVLNCIERQAELLHLDVTVGGFYKEVTRLELQLWIIDCANGVPNPLDDLGISHLPPDRFLG